MTINHGHYLIRKDSKNDVIHVNSSRYGDWQAEDGKGALLYVPPRRMPAGATRYGVRFRMISSNYFSTDNAGHFAFILRGGVSHDPQTGAPTLFGRGFILGNVSELSARGNGIGPAPKLNRAAIETWHPGEGAVFGETTSSPELENGIEYSVSCMICDSSAHERGRVIDLAVDGNNWTNTFRARAFDHVGKSDGETAGLAVVEVFSRHSWMFRVFDFEEICI